MSKFVCIASWNDAPHLSEEIKKEMLAAIPESQRRSRTEGVPYLGAGAIYPVPLDELDVDAFAIPDNWPRGFALDVGWNKTAALWGALDVASDILYCYSEHYVGQAEPVIHARSILGNGSTNLRAKWIPGVIDPAARGRSQHDGIRLAQTYVSLGLDLELADNDVQSGLTEVWQRLSSGRLKFFRHLSHLRAEYLLYRRGEDGKIVKKNDHLCDCLRYLVMSGIARMIPVPIKKTSKYDMDGVFPGAQNWMM